VRPAGFEPATHSLEGCCSIHLSYGRLLYGNNLGYSAGGAKQLLTDSVTEGGESCLSGGLVEACGG
jgi:hypothetical protein